MLFCNAGSRRRYCYLCGFLRYNFIPLFVFPVCLGSLPYFLHSSFRIMSHNEIMEKEFRKMVTPKRYHISSGTLSNCQICPLFANSISNICCWASYPADLIMGFAHIIRFIFCSRFLILLVSPLTEMSFSYKAFSYIFFLKEFPLYTFT